MLNCFQYGNLNVNRVIVFGFHFRQRIAVA
jgi:hypothetical protein